MPTGKGRRIRHEGGRQEAKEGDRKGTETEKSYTEQFVVHRQRRSEVAGIVNAYGRKG